MPRGKAIWNANGGFVSVLLTHLFIFELVTKWSVFCSSKLNLWLTYLVRAKSTGELISFGFCDHSVLNLVSVNANRWVVNWDQTKNDFIFWLIFGLSLTLGLSDSHSERLIQKVKLPAVMEQKTINTYNKAKACKCITLRNSAIRFKQLPQLVRRCAVTNIADEYFCRPKSITPFTQFQTLTITLVFERSREK